MHAPGVGKDVADFLKELLLESSTSQGSVSNHTTTATTVTTTTTVTTAEGVMQQYVEALKRDGVRSFIEEVPATREEREGTLKISEFDLAWNGWGAEGPKCHGSLPVKYFNGFDC